MGNDLNSVKAHEPMKTKEMREEKGKDRKSCGYGWCRPTKRIKRTLVA